MTTSNGALSDVRVLDLGTITAGAATSGVLADFGADVIKIEWPGQIDPFRDWTQIASSVATDYNASPPFHTVNRGKRSVGINLKSAEGRTLLVRLAARCDIVVENFRRGVLERLGLDFGSLREANPRIVLLSLTSQGVAGPDAKYGSFGSTLDALGGLMSITGYGPDEPLWSSNNVNYPDQLVSFLGPGAALAALRQARETGEAVWVDFSQREAVTFAVGEQFVRYACTGELPVPRENSASGTIQGVYESAVRDRWVAVSVPATDNQTKALLRAIGVSNVGEPLPVADQVETMLGEWVRRHAPDAAEQQLRAAGCAVSAVRNAAEVLLDDQLDALGFFKPVESRIGSTLQRGYTARMSRTPGAIRTPAPDLGQHTREVLLTIGLSEPELAELNRAGVIFAPDLQSAELTQAK
ncbi:MAG: CoA transferase [Acidobacteriaceae bacterium]|nr:CoA transferase [Acidobacteriaceae bacterium]